MTKEHSLARRYAYKSITSLLNLAISLAVAGVVPRALGVKDYGDFTYLINFFQQVAGFLDFRTSTYFYVRLSQDQSDKKLLAFYGSYLAIVISFFAVITLVITLSPFRAIILPNQITQYVFMGAVAGLLAWLLDVFVGCMDAYGVTVALEKARFVNKCVSAGVVLVMNRFNILNLQNAFVYQSLIALSLLSFITTYLIRRKIWRNVSFRLQTDVWRGYAKAFLAYSYPLFGYAILTIYVAMFDRWLLQKIAGSSEQGLYSFGFNMMSIGYLFITAIQPLIVREMSIAASSDDLARMAMLYHRIYPLLFCFTAYFSAFLFVEADIIVEILGGSEYDGAITPFRILMFYPLINVFAGLNSSIVLTMKKTKIFLVLGSIFAPIGSLFLFVLISPSMLSLGAKGLAIKIISIEFISVIVITVIIGKFIRMHAARTIAHFGFIFVFILVAYLGRELMGACDWQVPRMMKFGLSGVIYTLGVSALAILTPQFLGVSKRDINKILGLISNNYKKVRAS